jgi:hypothetical protein
MKYSYSCAMDNDEMSVQAKDDAQAVKKLTKLAKKHAKKHHTDATPMSDQEWESAIRQGWKKES